MHTGWVGEGVALCMTVGMARVESLLHMQATQRPRFKLSGKYRTDPMRERIYDGIRASQLTNALVGSSYKSALAPRAFTSPPPGLSSE